MANDSFEAALSTIGDEDLSRLLRETPVQKIEFHKELPSTNDLALQLADEEGVEFPLLVLTESQTAGRGRQSNRWWSDAGALAFSLIMETKQANLPTNLWPQASLTAGLAMCEALESFLPGTEISIKWPNDVYVGSRKICGILVETPRLHQNSLVIGIGVNVNNSLASGPDDITGIATSMVDLLGNSVSLVEVLVKAMNKLFEHIGQVGSKDEELRENWRKRCYLTDHRLRVEGVKEALEGVCLGIDDEGALILNTESGERRILAGTIHVLN